MSKLHGNRIEVGNISTSNRNSLSNVNGHLIYNTDTNLLQYYNPAGWQSLGDASPNTKSDYPTPTGSTVVFTSTWPGSQVIFQYLMVTQLGQHQVIQQKQE